MRSVLATIHLVLVSAMEVLSYWLFLDYWFRFDVQFKL